MAEVFNAELQELVWKPELLVDPNTPIEVSLGLSPNLIIYPNNSEQAEMQQLYNSGAWFLFNIVDKVPIVL